MPPRAPHLKCSQYSRPLLTLLLVALTALAGALNGLGRTDQLAYDRALSLAGRPAPADVVLIMIDDESLAALGRWPWPRAVHAALLDRLHDARAVGLDIVFADADEARPESDRALAEAIARHGRVVLPVVLDNLESARRVEFPLAPLADAAASLGFINIVPDADGVVRHATWNHGAEGRPWRHFALAMLQAGGQDRLVQDFLRHLPGEPTFIPYIGAPGHFSMVSYLSVLRGDLPPDYFRDKYVLVGTWATGMGDIFPSPVSHRASGISGVEIMGTLLQSVREGRILRTAPPWLSAAASAVPVLLLCLALPWLSPRLSVLSVAVLLALVLIAAAAALSLANLWIPPTAALLGVAVCYPVWSWRSQEAALRYMAGELRRLRLEYPPIMQEAGTQDIRVSRSLDQHVAELDQALSRVRNLRRFLIDGLDGLPDATLVIDQAGRLQFRNRPAVMYFLNLSIRPPRIGGELAPALQQAFDDPSTRQMVGQALHAPRHDAQTSHAAHSRIEVRDRAGNDLLLRCAPIHTARGDYAGLVVSLSDITAIRQAERQREETLRFISHDMRAPQNSILALVALKQSGQGDEPAGVTLSRIAQLAHRTLGLVDDFIHLTRAESMDITRAPLDLADMARDVADEFWAAAQGRRVGVHVQAPPAPALAYGDHALVRRAICNLVDNAIKYSPPGGQVQLSVSAGNEDTWDLVVQDAGPGIAPDEQRRLFQPFFRTGQAHRSDVQGAGLGLAFVKTVAQRHGGRVSVHSETGAGARFTLTLPKALDDAIYND